MMDKGGQGYQRFIEDQRLGMVSVSPIEMLYIANHKIILFAAWSFTSLLIIKSLVNIYMHYIIVLLV